MATFGKTAVGGSANPDGSQYFIASPYVLSEPGNVSKLTLYCSAVGATTPLIKGFIFSDVVGVPTTRLGLANEVQLADGAAAAWVDLPFPSLVALTAGTYWPGFISLCLSGSISHYYDALSNGLNYAGDNYATPSTSFGSPGVLNQEMSVYATYSTAAPPPPYANVTITA